MPGLPLSRVVDHAPDVECVFGDGPAVGRWYFSAGCVAFRDLHQQDLCLHHLINATPISDDQIVLLADYTFEQIFARDPTRMPHELRGW